MDSTAVVSAVKEQMLTRKAGASKAAAETQARSRWNAAREEEQLADRALSTRAHSLALERYKNADALYAAAADEARGAERAATAGITELKTMIAALRGEMTAEKQAAERAGAREGAETTFRNAESREKEGDRLIRTDTREDLLKARGAYSSARDGYKTSVTETRRAAALKSDADSRRNEMRAARQNVPGSDSEKQSSPSYRSAATAEAQAERMYETRDYRGARDAFAGARKLFVDAGREVLAARTAAAEKEAAAVKPAESRVPERVDPAVRERAERETARREIQRMVDQYRENIEQGNLRSLAVLLNLSSGGQDEWEAFFQASRDRKVSIETVDPDVTGSTARVNFKVKMSFYNETANTTQTLENARQWTMESKDGVWKVITQK
jgi:hypothetical protein